MPSGIYDRTLSDTYKGFTRIGNVKAMGGGSYALVQVNCCDCKEGVVRTAKAVNIALRLSRGFLCPVCHGKRRRGKPRKVAGA